MEQQQCQWTNDEMLGAIHRNEFIPFFQPKIDLATGICSCVEILARWDHPQWGILPPSQFISVIEHAGLIDQFTDKLFRQALLSARAHTNLAGVGMAMNFSATTLQHPGISNRICSMVREYGMAFDQITIEVTESALPENYASVISSLQVLRTKGFHISMDDFGTGYSSLELLTKLPFTELKIDRAFIAGIASDTRLAKVLEVIVDLAQKLRLSTVAEGIETKAQRDFMQHLGCNIGQGFYFGAAKENLEDAMRNVERRQVHEEMLLAAA
jgi:EAL domain-containing protein (putative c-di-GMP-specific phosphodiesterase class I)